MAYIWSFNLTQTESHVPKSYEFSGFQVEYETQVSTCPRITSSSFDLNVKNINGYRCCFFWGLFVDKRMSVKSRSAELLAADGNGLLPNPTGPAQPAVEITVQGASPVSESKPPVSTRPPKRSVDEPIKCLVYNDPFGSTAWHIYSPQTANIYLEGWWLVILATLWISLLSLKRKYSIPFLFVLVSPGFVVIVFLESIGCTAVTIYRRCQKGRGRWRRPWWRLGRPSFQLPCEYESTTA